MFCASAFGEPHPNSSPKVIVPRAASETRSPHLPSNLYFIIVFLSFALRHVPQLFSDSILTMGVSENSTKPSKLVETLSSFHFASSFARSAETREAKYTASLPSRRCAGNRSLAPRQRRP